MVRTQTQRNPKTQGKTTRKASLKKAREYPTYRGAEAIRFLVSTGILWYVNKIVFHLLGFKFLLDEERGEILIEDHREYPNVVYTSDAYKAGEERFAKYMQDRGTATMKLRRQILGFTTQETPTPTVKTA